MKKRNVMTMALSLAMVGVIGVGGTLAYLTATDDAVTNTFSFVQGDPTDPENPNVINVKLTEDKPEMDMGDVTVEANGKGWAYKNVVPGQTLEKEPKVSVKTQVDTYVFIRVNEGVAEADFAMEPVIDASNWEKVATTENVYVYKTVVEKNDALTALASPFSEIKVPDTNDTKDKTLSDVKIEVAAIQATGFADANDAYTNGNVAGLFKNA